MKKYQIQNSIGSGNFSTVFKAIWLADQSPCAVKILKSHHNIALREAQLLKKFNHPNIISIIDFQQTPHQSRLILQYLGINTLDLYESQTNGLKQQQVKCILFQVALGLAAVHSQHIIHRDIKPENILIDKKSANVKIIDFGLAVQENLASTDYIATRWYRAPELLLTTKQYNCAVDVFSLACVIVQLYLGKALFPGVNNFDQIIKIIQTLGYPTQHSWPKGYNKLTEIGIQVNNVPQKLTIAKIMSACNPKLIELLQKMLILNPENRIKMSQILKHEYFKDIKVIVPPAVYKRYEEDYLNTKKLNFKGFLPVKCGKQATTIQQITKNQKINFHNISSNRDQQIKIPSSNLMNQPIIRVQKSSSVDSRHFSPHTNQTHKLSSNKSTNSFQNLLPNKISLNINAHSPNLSSTRKQSESSRIIINKTNQSNRKISAPCIPNTNNLNSPKASVRQLNNLNNLNKNNIKNQISPPKYQPIKNNYEKMMQAKLPQSRPAVINIIKPKQYNTSQFNPNQNINSPFNVVMNNPMMTMEAACHQTSVQNHSFVNQSFMNNSINSLRNNNLMMSQSVGISQASYKISLQQINYKQHQQFKLHDGFLQSSQQKMKQSTKVSNNSETQNYQNIHYDLKHPIQKQYPHLRINQIDGNHQSKKIKNFNEINVPQFMQKRQIVNSPKYQLKMNHFTQFTNNANKNMEYLRQRQFLSPNHQIISTQSPRQIPNLGNMPRHQRLIAVNSPIPSFFHSPTIIK